MFSNAFAALLVKGLLHGTAIPKIFDPAAVGPLAKVVLRLHTADPGPNGTQETNELTYVGYAPVEVDRSAAKWPVTGNVAKPSARIEFGEMRGGTEQLATWVTLGTAATGPGMVMLRGRLSPDIQCRPGVIPAIKADTTITFVTATP